MIDTKRVIGIDIGTATTGWAVLEKEQASRNGIKVLGYGIISTSAKSPMPDRLAQIFQDFHELVETYQPSVAVIESLFFFKNQTTVMTVSQSRGVVILAAQQKGLRVEEFTPLQVKMGVTGYGRADKRQVQEMVKQILGLKEIPKPDDAADALAIAICYLNGANSII